MPYHGTVIAIRYGKANATEKLKKRKAFAGRGGGYRHPGARLHRRRRHAARAFSRRKRARPRARCARGGSVRSPVLNANRSSAHFLLLLTRRRFQEFDALEIALQRETAVVELERAADAVLVKLEGERI